MKKRGFTLIELLAVIVVLAIIALIATPIVMNVIKKANEGAAERSAERYVDAVETAIATDRLENDLIADGTYSIVDGQLEGTALDIKVTGDYPKSGTIAVEKGQVVSTGTSMIIGDYEVTIDSKGQASAALYDPYALGTAYQIDPGNGVVRTFYVLEVKGDNVSLIMDRNIDDELVAWCKTGSDVACDADGAKAALASKTRGWTSDKIISIDLPSVEQVLAVDGYDLTTYKGEELSSWLYDHLHYDVSIDPNGYWTSTYFDGTKTDAYVIYYAGGTNFNTADNDYMNGIRPVITIAKTNL